MDFSYPNIRLHPEAQPILFQHYQVFRQVFHDVLGHFEIDHISIALINAQNELFFLSSKKSIELNLIKNNLWQTDPIFQTYFFEANQINLWTDIYSKISHKKLFHFKLNKPGFSQGISIPASFENYRVVYSFAITSKNKKTQNNLLAEQEKLNYLGRYCLKNILKNFDLPKQSFLASKKKPFLKLVINNEVSHAPNS